jgi:hypothetical protein
MREKKQGKPMAGTDRKPIGAVNGAVLSRLLFRDTGHIK